MNTHHGLGLLCCGYKKANWHNSSLPGPPPWPEQRNSTQPQTCESHRWCHTKSQRCLPFKHRWRPERVLASKTWRRKQQTLQDPMDKVQMEEATIWTYLQRRCVPRVNGYCIRKAWWSEWNWRWSFHLWQKWTRTWSAHTQRPSHSTGQ